MLVNMQGVEKADEVIDLNDRRPEVPLDPKSRVTLTTLFSTVLASFITAGSSSPPVRTASVLEHDFSDAASGEIRNKNSHAA